MYEGLRVRDLLVEMKKKAGSNRRLADAIGVTEKTVSEWLKKATEDELRRGLHASNLEGLIKAAQDKLEIELALFSPAPPLWDHRQSYDNNLALDLDAPPSLVNQFRNHRIQFLGFTVNSRLGASASVITSNATRIKYLSRAGLDVITYKTVRSCFDKGHPSPNIFFCATRGLRLEPKQRFTEQVLVEERESSSGATSGMMNRFGMPSPSPEVWQADFREAQRSLLPGQLLILSVTGTAHNNDSESVLVDDFRRVADLAIEAGAKVIEINSSCPNCSGMEGSLYQNLRLVRKVCETVADRTSRNGVKVLLKIGFLTDRELAKLVIETAAFIDGYSAINSVPIEGLRQGQTGPVPAYGQPKLKAGLSGAPILHCGLYCVQNLVRIFEKERLNGKVILGIGGVSTPADVSSYVDSGAHIVQAATVFFEDPLFGVKARQQLDNAAQLSALTPDDVRVYAHQNWTAALLLIEKETKLENIERLQTCGTSVLLEWERRFRETISLGPTRQAIPEIDHFLTAIRAKMSSAPKE